MRLTAQFALTATLLAPLTQIAFAQGGFNGPGRYQILNVETRKPLDLAGVRLVQNSPSNSRSQVWDLQQAGPDVFYIRNGATGCALQFTQDRNSAPVICPPASCAR